MRERIPYGLIKSIFLMGFLLSIVAHAENKFQINKEGSKQRTVFIENKGQIIDQNNLSNTEVRYLLPSPGFNVQLRKNGFSYDIYTVLKPKTGFAVSKSDFPQGRISDSSVISFHRIDFTFLDINLDFTIETEDQSRFYYNYYTTGTPLDGITNVHTFSKIIYRNFYPGIDLIFESTSKNGFKYSFQINPGGNLQKIKFLISETSRELQQDGSISLNTEYGNFREIIPESYRIIKDIKKPIEITFTQSVDDIFGFKCDSKIGCSETLVIDPIPERLWGTYFGGEFTDGFYDIVLGASGNSFSCGFSRSVSNVATAGAYQTTLAGLEDAIIVNFDASGGLVWATYFGGSGLDNAESICIDNDFLIISGETKSTNNIATPGTFQQTFGGGSNSGDAFVEKFNTSGFRIWGTYYGGSGDEYGWCTSKNSQIYLYGQTSSTTGISSPGSFQPLYGGSISDAYLAKLDANGNRSWGTYYGGSLPDGANTCGILNDTVVVIAGATSSSNNISTPGSFQPVIDGLQDGFIASFDTNGNRRWGTYYGGPGGLGTTDLITSCAIKSPDLLYFGGRTNALNNISTSGTFQPNFGGGSEDGYIVRFDPSGNRIWGTYFGGPGDDLIEDIAIDDSNYVVVDGLTSSLTGISTPGSYQPSYGGGLSDTFFGKLDPSGNRIWSSYYGGNGSMNNEASFVALKGNLIYLAGLTDSPNNIASPGAFKTQLDVTDGFLAKFCFPPDSASLISGPIDVCANSSSIGYSVPPIPWAQSYLWNIPVGVSLIAGQHTNSITVNFGLTATSGYISVMGINDCGPGDSSYLYVNVHSRPVPVITGQDSSCVQSLEIYSTQTGKSNYQWNKSSGGQVISGGTAYDDQIQIKWLNPGTQWIEVNYTDTNSCSAIVATHFPVTVNPGDSAKVSITASGNNICSGTPVTFTAVPTNPGALPAYQWKVNGSNAGGNSSVFTYTPVNGDQVQCILTSSITVCISNNPATSNIISMIVNPLLPVSVSVSASANIVCAGTAVTFTAAAVNGGLTPVYQWKVNGIPAGTNSQVYTYTPLNNDAITCTLASSEACITGNPATSSPVIMTVNPLLPVGISISALSNPFCLGTSVTLTATPVNGGPLVVYQWKVNGINAGTNNPTFTFNPVSGDVVTCLMNSSLQCVSGNPATSNAITLTGIPGLPASVSITANPNPFCPGSSVTFTATPGNGGATPSYQWKVNGVNVGTNSPTFTYNPLNNDSVRCVMTSTLSCISANPATSNKIILNGTLAPVITFTSCFDTVTTVNAKPIKLKGGIPLNGVYSGPGVSAGIFDPAVAGIGTKSITYTYSNVFLCSASKTRTITVQAVAQFTCGNTLTDIRDGKTYPSVQIGTQCWMAANLNRGVQTSSSQVQFDNCIDEKFCYGNDPAKCSKYGGLYQWDEMMRYDDIPAGQGICPPGWHVPTENDWTVLCNYYNGFGFAGKPLQDTFISGFRALTGGVLYLNSSWSFEDFAVLFWTSTSWGNYKALSHGMNSIDFSVSLYPSSRANAFPVRCLHD